MYGILVSTSFLLTFTAGLVLWRYLPRGSTGQGGQPGADRRPAVVAIFALVTEGLLLLTSPIGVGDDAGARTFFAKLGSMLLIVGGASWLAWRIADDIERRRTAGVL